jgi:transcriptional regulator with XRE-family HTH domain
MADFADEVRQFMAKRGMSLRGLAKAAHYDASLLSKVLNGHRPYSPYLAASLDHALGAGGRIENAARQQAPKPPKPSRAPRRPSRAVEALQAVMADDAAELDIASDGLTELVSHYATVLAVAPSAAVYDDLLSVRSFAGALLGRGHAPPGQRPDLIVTAGWLSSLLSISAADIGDHAAAQVWCADTERRGRDAGYPELLGWAALTRALIAYYQGQPRHSAAVARRGQETAPLGTVAHAKLAAQEMRSLAMLGDAAGMADARRRAAVATGKLTPAAATTGVYSIPRADDPPYTATSLLLVKRYKDAAETTRRLIETGYSPQSRTPGDQPTNYARTLLILALAEAGLGCVEEASAAGSAALECGRLVWPTMVLAARLDQSLARGYPQAAATADYHARYIDAADRLARPARRPRPPEEPT